jgi:hypothetical protein
LIINPGVHDLGCTLKVYKRECFDQLDLRGEMHRYIVAILKWQGFTIGEVEVEHKERVGGQTNYNWKKMFRGFVDMWLVWFTQKYSDRPLHLFGVSGMFMAALGSIWLLVLGILRFLELVSLSTSIFPLIAILLIILGVQLFAFGIMMDAIMKNFYSLKDRRSYLIKEEF